MIIRRRPNPPKGIMVVDFENLIDNLPISLPETFLSISQRFENLIERIAQQVGEITNVFVFAPEHVLRMYSQELYDLDFFMISCPKIRPKAGGIEEDTSDHTLINFGKIIADLPNLTFFCLVSGDRDFSRDLLKPIKRKGLKTVVVGGSLSSFSGKLIKEADLAIIFGSIEDAN